MAEYKSRITGRIEEWWKKACIEHNCKYYIHEDYPKCSYCTCPNNCILVNEPKAESDDMPCSEFEKNTVRRYKENEDGE